MSPDLRKRITIEVESFSGRSAVSLGKSCEILADYLVICANVLEEPVTYVLSREEAERLIREDRRGEYWIEVKDYDREEYRHRLDSLRAPKLVIKGLPASPGIVFGKARICLTPAEAEEKMRQGDVPVIPETRDPEWVPYIKRASAIVMEGGDATYNISIVCRELNVPCIVGAKDATKRLVDPQYTIDATFGAVYEGRVEELIKGQD